MIGSRYARTLATLRRGSAAAALVAVAPVFLLAPECRAETPEVVSFDVDFGPVAVDGQFPLVIKAPGQTLNAELKVATDLGGKLKGQLLLNGLGLSVSGTVRHTGGATVVEFRASGPGTKLVFSGTLTDGVRKLDGMVTGKGPVPKGTYPFTLDLTTASTQVVRVDCSLTPDAKGRVKGVARVISGGTEFPLVASGKTDGSTLTLAIKKSGFKFTGTGPTNGTGVVVDWSALGFGSSAAGTGLTLIGVRPPVTLRYPAIPSYLETDDPIANIAPITGDAPRGTFAVSPTLPEGLTFDVATGVISGTITEIRPQRQYTVTAANFAGSSSVVLSFATRIPKSRSLAAETRFFNDEDLRHFLRRAEFGSRQLGAGSTSLDRVKTIGLAAYVDNMMILSPSGLAEQIAAPELVNPNDPVALRGKLPSAAQISAWWASLMMNSDNPFQERIAFFWADRFAVSANAFTAAESHLMREYIDLYRFEGTTNLRNLLRKMSRSGAMLKYLDGATNTVGAPNENFAREFWELFTLGVDNGYTQADIVQAARAWTGWKLVPDASTLVNPVFDPTLHDVGVKNVLGTTVGGQSAADDFDAMIDVTLANRDVAEFIATKLFEQFCYENPPQVLVDEMAASLRASDYELKPFLRTLFLSEAFFSAKARSNLVKNPVDYAIGFIHATGLKITPANLTTMLTTLGQAPGQVPSVNGFPEGVLWFHAQNMTDRAALVAACVDDTARQASVGIQIGTMLPPVGQRTALQIVDSVAVQFGLTLSTTERQRCVDYMNTPTPFDPTSQAHLDDRARGVLFILAQHPQYEIR